MSSEDASLLGQMLPRELVRASSELARPVRALLVRLVIAYSSARSHQRQARVEVRLWRPLSLWTCNLNLKMKAVKTASTASPTKNPRLHNNELNCHLPSQALAVQARLPTSFFLSCRSL